MQILCKTLYLSEGGGGGEEGGVGLYGTQPPYFILRHLLKLDNRSKWITLVLVARGLAAPRGAVDYWGAILYPYYGIIVVEQPCSLYVLHPEAAVCALACAALAQEGIALGLIYNYR